MRTVNLEIKELEKVEEIIKKYKTVESYLEDVQKKLETLDLEKEKLFKDLENIRVEERKFFTKLKKKHGEGHFDIYSMKYVIKDGKN